MHALNKSYNRAETKRVGEDPQLKLVSGTKQMRKTDQKNTGMKKLTLDFLAQFDACKEDLYDFVFQILGEEESTAEVIEHVCKVARKRAKRNKFDQYARIWFFQIVTSELQSRFEKWGRDFEDLSHLPLTKLTIEERFVLMLRDRVELSRNEISCVLQLSEGAVEMRLMSAREKLAKRILNWPSCNPFSFASQGNNHSLKVRLAAQRYTDGELKVLPAGEEVRVYSEGMQTVRKFVSSLDAPEMGESVAMLTKNPFQVHTSWRPLPWHYKFVLESFAFALVGTLAVFVMPSVLAYYNGDEAEMRRAQAVLPMSDDFVSPLPQPVRALASINADTAKALLERNNEFAGMDFPSGHYYRRGSAPLAPSRKKSSIYRLIVQSENPRDMVPKIKSLFRDSKVVERARSGRRMPGGVYFDGVTTEANYRKIRSEISRMGPTATYLNQKRKRKLHEPARVIIWVQQI